MKLNDSKIAYYVGVFGVIITLFWVGLFKFTLKEALAIKPLVENHFGMSWMYKIMNVQTVSNVIGIVEIIVALGLVLSFFYKKAGIYAGQASAVIFATTLSFIATTPGIFGYVDGLPLIKNFLIMDFFILKDIPFLGISLWVYAKSKML